MGGPLDGQERQEALHPGRKVYPRVRVLERESLEQLKP
jgi:hypothetical protein